MSLPLLSPFPESSEDLNRQWGLPPTASELQPVPGDPLCSTKKSPKCLNYKDTKTSTAPMCILTPFKGIEVRGLSNIIRALSDCLDFGILWIWPPGGVGWGTRWLKKHTYIYIYIWHCPVNCFSGVREKKRRRAGWLTGWLAAAWRAGRLAG